jgi:hypothetical protein
VAHSGAGFRLRGRSEGATYRVKLLDGKLVEKQEILSGAFLMNDGLNLWLEGDFDSTAVLLERID